MAWSPVLVQIGKYKALGINDHDGNENVKKAVGFMSKTTLHAQHTLQYITLLSLHNFNFNVKFPSFTFNGGRRCKTQIFGSELG